MRWGDCDALSFVFVSVRFAGGFQKKMKSVLWFLALAFRSALARVLCIVLLSVFRCSPIDPPITPLHTHVFTLCVRLCTKIRPPAEDPLLQQGNKSRCFSEHANAFSEKQVTLLKSIRTL